MQRILLTVLLATAAFTSFTSSPASAIEGRACQERQEQMNKAEDSKSHRRQHREQILNKQAQSGTSHRQEHRQQVMNKHVCS